MKIVTGFRGENHITSNDDQGRNQGIFGNKSYVLKVGSQFAPTLASATELLIADGEGMLQGVHFRIPPGSRDSLAIDNGTQGMKRIDLVVAHYTKNAETDIENVSWVIIKGTPTSGTPAMPTFTEGNVLAGQLEANMAMFAIDLDGISISGVRTLFQTVNSLDSSGSEEAFTYKNGFVYADTALLG